MSQKVDLGELLSKKFFFLIVLCWMFSLYTLIILTYCWKSILIFFAGKKIRFIDALYVYAKSNLGKYVPGNIGHYAGRQLFGSDIGISQTQLLLASFLEIICGVMNLFILLAIFSHNQVIASLNALFPEINYLTLIVFLIALAIFVGGAVCYMMRKKPFASEIVRCLRSYKFWLMMAKIVFLLTLNQLLLQLIYVLFIRALLPSSAVIDIAAIISAGTVSHFIGYITPGAPGGMGVRESVLILMLSSIYSSEVVLTAGIFQRIGLVAGDILAWILGIILKRGAK